MGTERALIVLNFSDGTPTFELPVDTEHEGTELLLANYEGGEADEKSQGIDSFELRPWEARAYRLR
jgi:oligo-1,6-glucosidase